MKMSKREESLKDDAIFLCLVSGCVVSACGGQMMLDIVVTGRWGPPVIEGPQTRRPFKNKPYEFLRHTKAAPRSSFR